MSRSVTKAVLITAIPLLALALVSLLGSPRTPQKAPTAAHPIATAHPLATTRVAVVHPGHPV